MHCWNEFYQRSLIPRHKSTMPSWKTKKKPSAGTDTSSMATSGRYIRKDQHPSPRLDYYPSSTVVRNVTMQRKSEQTKGSRSHSVPSLNSMDVTTSHISPTRTPRSNSVRGSKSSTKAIKKKIAKMLGSHSDLTGKVLVSDERSSTGVYKQIGGFRPRSIGGSSDCSNSSLTSTQQQSELSRNNSLRDSTRSKLSQGSVFSTSRQASYDSADAINISVHGGSSIVPSESGLRPRSIACMQRSGSSTSLRVNSVDPRYHSIATVPLRHDIGADTVADGRKVYRFEQLELEEISDRVRPSDPGYKKIAADLMTCSPQPQDSELYKSTFDGSHLEKTKKYFGEMESGSSSPKVDSRQPFSFEEEPGKSLTTAFDRGSGTTVLPSGWEIAELQNGLKYYIDHNTQTTRWKLPSDRDEDSLPDGWEIVQSKQYGKYYVNHNNRTALYQHPVYGRPPPPYHLAVQYEDEEGFKDRKGPIRSHSHRGSQNRVVDPVCASLPRRSKSFRDREAEASLLESAQTSSESFHTRQLSTMTYVPPSPFSIIEIPQWLKNYVDAPLGSNEDSVPWNRYSSEDLIGLDTMIKRLLKKNTEQFVKSFEYYRVALQKEMDSRLKTTSNNKQPATDNGSRSSSQQRLPGQHKAPTRPDVPLTTTPHVGTTYSSSSPSLQTSSYPHSLSSNEVSVPPLPAAPHLPPAVHSQFNSAHKNPGGGPMYRTSSTPPVMSRDPPSYSNKQVNSFLPPHQAATNSNYHPHFNITSSQQGSTYFIPSPSDHAHKDVYDGLPETFV